MQEYVGLSKERIYGSDNVAVVLELPEKIDVPGPHKLNISIRELVPEGSTGIRIVGDIKANLIVNVPYPGKYLETAFSASDARYGEFSEFNLKVRSRGEEDLTAFVKIEVYNSKNETIKEIDLGEHFIKSQQTIEFNEKFDTIGHRSGEYRAVATVKYEDNKVVKEEIFRIGELIVNIIGNSDTFTRGIINRFDVELESLWNDPIEEVYAEILIPNYNIAFKTPFETVDGFSRTNLTGYFDPTSIDKDSFFGSITIYYGGKEFRKLVALKIKTKIPYATYLSIAGIILVILLITALIALSLWKRKVEKDLKKKRNKR